MPSVDLCQNIYNLVCNRPGESFDPSGVVRPDIEGEKQATQMYQDIIHHHKDWSPEQVDEKLANEIFTLRRRNRIEAAFHWARHGIERFVDTQPSEIFSELEKRQIKNRLFKIELQLPYPASIYEDEPDIFTANQIYYERLMSGKMRVRVGGAYLLIAKSWFNLIFTFAHEIAHSIDPCEVAAAKLVFPSYGRLTECFIQKGLILVSKNRHECGPNDQLSEAFADWIATQVTAESLTVFSTEFHGKQVVDAARNSVRDLCGREDDLDPIEEQFHPSPQKRIELIFGHNPRIRELLGCKKTIEPDYCTLSYVGEE